MKAELRLAPLRLHLPVFVAAVVNSILIGLLVAGFAMYLMVVLIVVATVLEIVIAIVELSARRGERARFLTALDAPLLAELWDNEEDAVYDNL